VESAIRIALRGKPRTISSLAQEMGDNWQTRRSIIRAYHQGHICLKPVNPTNLLILSQVLLILIELLPGSIRGLPALFALFGIPYLWDRQIIEMYNLDTNYTLPLVVLELIIIGFLLGYAGYFFRTAIAFSLFIATMMKWGILTYFKNSYP
jgi:hypothetical protein